MKIANFTSPNFKGYDAIPLKALHISPQWGEIENELKEIAQKENIQLKTSIYNDSFNQDLKTIIKDGKDTKLLIEDGFGYAKDNLSNISHDYNMPVELIDRQDKEKGFLSGGNFFLGKYPNGEKWILAGELEEFLAHGKKPVSKLYDVKEENIFYINQQDYHLDLSIRPIGYPYVLVNNPEMCLKNELKAKGQKLHSKPTLDKDNFKMQSYKKSIQQLKNAGFIPIPIAGVYDGGMINFINAVVNKHQNGSISYITNSSKCNDPFKTKLERMFEKDLKTRLSEINKGDKNSPKLQNIYFVQGENYGNSNEIMENLIEGAGGVHCMTLEEPNFDIWG